MVLPKTDTVWLCWPKLRRFAPGVVLEQFRNVLLRARRPESKPQMISPRELTVQPLKPR